MMKRAEFALFASVFAFLASDMSAEANTKYRIHDHHHMHDHHHDTWKISCNTARHMIQERGYKPVTVKSCISTVYSFFAVRGSRTYIFRVDSRTGFISRG